MKKVLLGLGTAVALFFVACSSSVDSLISQYEKACEKGETFKAIEIAEKIDQKTHGGEDLSPEQTQRMMDAALKSMKSIPNRVKTIMEE